MQKTFHLPLPEKWTSPADVFSYTRSCLEAAGLSHWTFGWDRAVKRLGCCHATQCRITLSKHFVATCLTCAPEQIRDTILHELAHALAWENGHHIGHGVHWKAWCRILGATPKATTADCPNFTPRTPRYRLQHRDTGEIYREYVRRPHFRHPLKRMYLRGHPETLGKLILTAVTGE